MSDSLIFYIDRADEINIIDPHELPINTDIHPLLKIAIKLIRLNHKGIAIDERQLKNGRYFQAINFDQNTPAGAVMAELHCIYEAGDKLPKFDSILSLIDSLEENNWSTRK